jgi:hypothetical protein
MKVMKEGKKSVVTVKFLIQPMSRDHYWTSPFLVDSPHPSHFYNYIL